MKHPNVSQQTRTDAGLAAVLRVAVGRLARRLRAQRPDASLSLGQGAVLFALARHGQLTPGALADHEKVQPPSMTRIIAALEERGLVRRMKHPDDRRQQLVELTEEGVQLVRADQRRREAWLTQRLRELTPEEKATLRKAAEILERLSQS
ncbi:MarR family transcriptional regulator [Marinitenerispora sediminis]|uniref:MarR family transcriptional regulator n=2 Tax=Marinitenerispora sediminis TaxID=1931232 RepID=A0A368T6W7_9ACTN|nr:MarR family transcriptional regulator [Marinitenerispora sediminis]RCV54883.1 MarR family transcriptional regulator [Marinitenerispora sediminis]RCV59254.1 MarR family transcriptional regulator [Marinitenerispora sediminis]RCV60284.1 MarR family transcriptional regulator [Marinitenerispora sediminis]